MANEKQINSRIQMKHDIEANWYAAGTATNPFIPKAGEVIIYDPDGVYENVRTKVGDGSTPVHLLKWATGCDESVGLEFELINDNKEYSVKGIGVCVDTELVIPKGYQGKPVTYICDYAFAACDVFSSVVIPDGVTTIGVQAFGECDYLSSVVIGDSVTSIGKLAFYCCYELSSIVIPNSVTSIGESTFYDCINLTSVVIPDSMTSIGHEAFVNCYNLTDIYYIGTGAQWEALINNSYSEQSLGIADATIHYDYADDFMSVNDRLGDISTALDNIILQTEAILGYSAAQQLAEEAAKQSAEEEEGGNE